jgi:glycosyltransferase involved in cell wall biosynthesis
MYPYEAEPTFGLFVHNQAKELSKLCQIIVLSPTPISPPIVRRLKAKWARYASKAKKVKIEGVNVYYPRYVNPPGKHGYLPGAILMFLGMGRLVRKLKSSFGFDLIHAHNICLDGLAAVWLGGLTSTPVVNTLHGSDINVLPSRSRLTRVASQWAIRNVDGLIAVSIPLKEGALALGIPRREIVVIPNGVDTQQFLLADQSQARARLGLGGDRKIIVYISRLDKMKGLSHLLSAFKTVSERNGGCLLALVGDGPYKVQLEKQVAQLQLEESVLFAGLRPHGEIPAWISACDLVVHPSLLEGSPLPIYESLACGKPVVASRVGGIPELIVSDAYGLLVPPADPEALADSLSCALEKRWDSRIIRNHGVQYSWCAVAERLVELYRHVLQEQ